VFHNPIIPIKKTANSIIQLATSAGPIARIGLAYWLQIVVWGRVGTRLFVLGSGGV